MNISYLSDHEDGATISADLVVIGGGPVGLTIARNCAREGRKVLILESGMEEDDDAHNALQQVENIGEPKSEAQMAMRREYHSTLPKFWSQERQGFGVTCRGLGGSTQAWSGKSAPFDPIDFEQRSWVKGSDWPVGHSEIAPFVERARKFMQLSDKTPSDLLNADGMRSHYWQFARSGISQIDVMRFGDEFLHNPPDHVDLMLGATVTQINLDAAGQRVESLDVANLSGKQINIKTTCCVLAASTVGNAQMLLASNRTKPAGIGNEHDNVGRYLMDHPSCIIGKFHLENATKPGTFFGMRGVVQQGSAHMFVHGITVKSEEQRKRKMLNCAMFSVLNLAQDDPWDAFKRLLRRQSKSYMADITSVFRGASTLFQAIGLRFLQSSYCPDFLRKLVVNAVILFRPNLAVDNFLNRGVPMKMIDLRLRALCEQVPDRESRVTLSETRDPLGTPIAKVDWKISDQEKETLRTLAFMTKEALEKHGFPGFELEDWIKSGDLSNAVVIDMAHTFGTTRMADRPEDGVVDRNCKVFSVENLYVSGGSVFPTASHANPTQMFVAFALRLSDHLNELLDKPENADDNKVAA